MSMKVIGFSYEKSKPSEVVQGIKNNQRPHDAVKGGCGSYRLASKSPKVNVVLEEEGERRVINYYDALKMQTTRAIINEKFATQVCEPLIGQEFETERDVAQAVYDNMRKVE